MKICKCSKCGYEFDDSAIENPEFGRNPQTKIDDLPDDWACPECGAPKEHLIISGDSH